MAQPVVVALVCSTLVFIHFGFREGMVPREGLRENTVFEKKSPKIFFRKRPAFSLLDKVSNKLKTMQGQEYIYWSGSFSQFTLCQFTCFQLLHLLV